MLWLLPDYWLPDKTRSFAFSWWCRWRQGCGTTMDSFLLLSSLISLYLPLSVCPTSYVWAHAEALTLSTTAFLSIHRWDLSVTCASNLGDSKKNPMAQGVACCAGRPGWASLGLEELILSAASWWSWPQSGQQGWSQCISWTDGQLLGCGEPLSWLHWLCRLIATN